MNKSAIIFVVIMLLVTILSACAPKCSRCDDTIKDDPVKANGRTYCSYECYLNDFWFD